MKTNASDHNIEHPGEWAISVAAHPSWSADQIARGALFIRHSQIRTSTVGAVRALGHDVRPSGRLPHADLHLRTMPSEPLFDALRGAFGDPQPNPRLTDD